MVFVEMSGSLRKKTQCFYVSSFATNELFQTTERFGVTQIHITHETLRLHVHLFLERPSATY